MLASPTTSCLEKNRCTGYNLIRKGLLGKRRAVDALFLRFLPCPAFAYDVFNSRLNRPYFMGFLKCKGQPGKNDRRRFIRLMDLFSRIF